MSYLVNDPGRFVEDMISGFVTAHPDLVRSVPGGVVRARRGSAAEVAVVVGGGSGHYPAFAGLVGPGLAHGAAMGNVFASPSAQQVYAVAKAAQTGGGVLLTYGNYAGDVLNFRQAEQRLLAEGIDCRTVLVTDDISSAPPAEIATRRGVAGDLFVFKIAAAGAEAGASLDEVARLAERANAVTRTLGVAFSGCTLPGADEPLFTVPPGRMGVGMGIHGEPGIDEADLPRADELAEMMLDRLLPERPDDARRAVVLVNGLGSVKSEELYVLFGAVAERLHAAGVDVVQPEIGELVTSFEMAGVSLTLCWVDDELERLWGLPARTAGYHKGSVDPSRSGSGDDDAAPVDGETGEAMVVGSAASQASARTVLDALTAAAAAIDAHADELGRLDAVAGDGDHGLGMQRGVHAGLAAASAAAQAGAGTGTMLCRAADAWADRAGGTSGALWGVMLRCLGARFGDEAAPDAAAVADGLAAAAAAVQDFGGAHVGDKTLVDVLDPFARVYGEQADAHSLTQAWAAAAESARRAADATADLLPRMGRARPHAAKSRGVPDPGAVSMAIVIEAVRSALSREAPADHGA